MENVSSSATLFLKLVLPTMYTVFFGTLVIALFFTSEIDFIGPFSVAQFRIGMLICMLIGLALMYWLFLRLKRVEMDEHYVYISNYFKTYRYPYHSIERFELVSHPGFQTCKIYLHESGKFGKKVEFLVHKDRFTGFLAQHSQIATQFFEGKQQDTVEGEET